MLTVKEIKSTLKVLEPLQKEASSFNYGRLSNAYSEVIDHLKVVQEKLEHGVSIFP